MALLVASASTTTAAEPTATEPTDTEPAASAPESQPASTESATDALAPQPLAERTEIKIILPVLLGSMALVGVADHYGEFEAENIDVSFEVVAPPNNTLVVAQGDGDMTISSLSAGTFNQIASGLDLQFFFPGAYSDPEGSDGVWVRNDLLRADGLYSEDLVGETLYSTGGAGNPLFYLVENINETSVDDYELQSTDLEYETFAAADTPVALQNGSINLALVFNPFSDALVGDDCCTRISPNNEYPTGNWMAGPTLLERPEVMAAITRALARTVLNHLQGDYFENAETLTAIATFLEQPEDVVAAQPELIFDSDILSALQSPYFDGAQTEFFARNEGQDPPLLTFTEPFEFEDLFDVSYVAEVVGT